MFELSWVNFILRLKKTNNVSQQTVNEIRTHAVSLTRNLVELVPWSIAATSGSMAELFPLARPSTRLEKRAAQRRERQLSSAKHSRGFFVFFFFREAGEVGHVRGAERGGGGGSTRKSRGAAALLAARQKASSSRWPIKCAGAPFWGSRGGGRENGLSVDSSGLGSH